MDNEALMLHPKISHTKTIPAPHSASKQRARHGNASRESSKQLELKNNLVTQHWLMKHSEMSNITYSWRKTTGKSRNVHKLIATTINL